MHIILEKKINKISCSLSVRPFMCDISDAFVVVEYTNDKTMRGAGGLDVDKGNDVHDVDPHHREEPSFMHHDSATQFYNQTQKSIDGVLYTENQFCSFGDVRTESTCPSLKHSLYCWITYQWGLFVALRYRLFVSRTMSFFQESFR